MILSETYWCDWCQAWVKYDHNCGVYKPDEK